MSIQRPSPSGPIRSTAGLAARLGLSRWTVSRVLNGHPGIHPETRDRVEREMKKLHFSPSAMARGLRGGRTGTIGIGIQDLENFNLVSKVSLLNERLRAHSLHGLLEFSDGQADLEEAILHRFIAAKVEGVVFFGGVLPRGHAAFKALAQTGIPFVPIDPYDSALPGAVLTDRAAAIRQAAGHLLTLGHRRFATLGIDPGTPYGTVRIGALQECLATQKATATCLSFFEEEAPRMDFDYGRRLAERLLAETGASRERPTALIALNDRIAFGAMEGLKRRGCRIPSDFSIVGYDNSDLGAFASPGLTTIDARADLLVEQAQRRLLDRIEGARQKGTSTRLPSPKRLLVEPALLVRESTAAPSS